MVKRDQRNIRFTDGEWDRLKSVSHEAGETRSGYVRRQIMNIVREEESQK